MAQLLQHQHHSMKTLRHASRSRRSFLKTAGTTAGSLLIMPSGWLRGQGPKPSGKLNVGFIGMGGQIQGHVGQILQLGHNVVAMCDVDSAQLEGSKKRHGEGSAKAATYLDYRMLIGMLRSAVRPCRRANTFIVKSR
jgi:hypothetical protein